MKHCCETIAAAGSSNLSHSSAPGSGGRGAWALVDIVAVVVVAGRGAGALTLGGLGALCLRDSATGSFEEVVWFMIRNVQLKSTWNGQSIRLTKNIRPSKSKAEDYLPLLIRNAI